jgi:hypothetical protein
VQHLRPPAIDHGVTSLLWGIFFWLFIWIVGGVLGFNGAVTFIIGLLTGFGSFLYIRIYGEDEPPSPG